MGDLPLPPVDGVLTTWPRERMRGGVLTHKLTLPSGSPHLVVEVAADPGGAWEVSLCADNQELDKRLIGGGEKIEWQASDTDLTRFAGKSVTLRLDQNVLSGNLLRPVSAAHWKSITLK